MMTDLIRIMKDIGIKSVIISDEIKDCLPLECLNTFDVTVNNDARSAAFYAYGKAQNENRPTALFVWESQLTHCYTALTEAMFQHVSFLVISITDTVRTVNHDYLHACIAAEFYIYSREDVYVFENSKQELGTKHGPILINTLVTVLPSVSRNKKVLSDISQRGITDTDVVMCHADYCLEGTFRCKTVTYTEEQRYGVISKYMGYLLGSKTRCILLMPVEFLKYDLNILNNRYLDNRFKVFLIAENGIGQSHQNWITSNGIHYSEVHGLDSVAIEKSLSSDNPEMCFVMI
jgi:hypothetical protein